jgi:hypothetical protein
MKKKKTQNWTIKMNLKMNLKMKMIRMPVCHSQLDLIVGM